MSSYSKLISHPHQPLAKHLGAVDNISAQALNAKFIAGSFASAEQLEIWRRLLVYFHDFGKSTVYFQHKIIKAVFEENPKMKDIDAEYVKDFYESISRFELEEELADDSRLGSHAELGAFAQQTNLKDEPILLRAILLEIVKRHHGDLRNFADEEFLLDPQRERQLRKQWAKADKKDYYRIIQNFGFSLPSEIDSLLVSYGNARMARKLNRELPALDIQPYVLTLFLFSLLLAADKGDMMLDIRDGIGRVHLFDSRAVFNFKSMKFGLSPTKPIDLIREEAYQLVEHNILNYPTHPFYSITLPTGLGKTLTAFNAALQLQNSLAVQYQEKGGATIPRIIYCLPFTSVIDQNATILEQILSVIGIPDGYLARHHYLSDWPEKKAQYDELTDSEKEYFTEGWEYPFTVTTFVQLLETIFSNRNRKLRKFHNLANAIIILDEVQNIPPKYFETVETMFQALFDYFNTRFIFVTATQPFLISGSEVVELTDPTRERTRRFFTDMDRITLDLSLWKEGPLPLEELIARFQKVIADNRNRSFLFILNKVKSSQKVFKQLKEQNPDAEMEYLSAAVLPALRKKRIDKIKNPPEGKQLIVVSTQVVEAGVDIDLDIVYRDLAPLDSINQSAGRCNRNAIKGKGEVRLFASEKGAGIYDAVLINITEGVLNRAIDRVGSNLIPEGEFYSLNEDYAREIRTKIADHNAHSQIIEWMKNMQFEKVGKEFVLIKQQLNRYSVFIDYCDESNQVWNEYQQLKKIKNRWERKKELRKLRPRLLQYVVQFPEKALPAHYQQDERPIIPLSKEEYPSYYSLETGYGVYEEPGEHQAVITN